MGKQVVPEIDRVERGVLGAVRGQPAMGGAVLAILFFSAVPGHDEFGFQRHNMVMPGRDQGGAQYGVEIFGLAVASQAMRAVRTMEFVGPEGLGPVQRDQYVAIGLAEVVDAAGLGPVPSKRRRTPDAAGPVRRGPAPAFAGAGYGPDMIVAGDAAHPEQGFAIGPAMAVAQALRVRQEGWALHEEGRERRHGLPLRRRRPISVMA